MVQRQIYNENLILNKEQVQKRGEKTENFNQNSNILLEKDVERKHKKTKLFEKCFSWIIGQYYIKDRSLHKHIMIMKWSVCVDSQFIGNSKKWLIRTKDKWIKHEIHKNDRNWNIHGALTPTSGKNNIFWLTTLVSNVHIFWAVLLFFIITLARDDFPEQTANSAQTQVWLPKNAWFGCNLITFSVVPVVMLTEFYIIQGLLAFVLFVWSAIKTHTKKKTSCAVLCCVVQRPC